MTQLAAGAWMFLRGDVAAAKTTLTRSYSREQVLDSLRLSSKEGPYFTPGFPLDLPLRHASRITSLDGPPTGAFPAAGAAPYVSDTGELAWYAKPGVVTIDTPRAEALIGFNKAQPKTLRHLAAEIDNQFCAITLTAIGQGNIAAGAPLLLSAAARAANTGMRWNEKRNALLDWGGPPTVIEPVTGTILLRNMSSNIRRIAVAPLDGAGRAIGERVWAEKKDGVWRIPIGGAVTPWYRLDPEVVNSH
jgi:hypothetical protein